MNHTPPARCSWLLPIVGAALLASCSGSGDDSELFIAVNTQSAMAGVSPVRVNERFMVYLASEALTGAAPGTNINTDGDFNDDCAVVVNMVAKTETSLPIATQSFEIVPGATAGTANIYLVVDEAADSVDWSGSNGTGDVVLLCWSSTTSTTTFVDVIEDSANVQIVPAGNRLYYALDDSTALANGETTLRYVDAAAPTVGTAVAAVDTGNTHKPRLLAADENLLFLYQDEAVEGRDVNNDTDTNDGFVLALLEARDPAALMRSVGLAIADDSAPLRARTTGTNDWLVAFLVNEAAQSDFATGLNDPAALGFPGAWKPTQCPGYTDTDTTDDVLHFLKFDAWDTDPVANPPVNTGLAGHDRVVALSRFSAPNDALAVATIARELNDGGCDLNGDGDLTDDIVRWVEVGTPLLPTTDVNEMVAIDTAVPGGTRGLTDLRSRLISVVDEADDNRDHDGDGNKTHQLVAWLDPAISTGSFPQDKWTFDHNASAANVQAAGAAWLAERAQRDRALVSFQESVFGQSINVGGDNDTLDSSPTFPLFDPGNATDFDFPGPAVAVLAINPGIAIANNVAFYRVDELADNRDWNGDNVKNDEVLFRTSLSNNFSKLVGVLNNLVGSSIAPGTSTIGAAFVVDETMANFDFNGDGQIQGFAVRWMRIG
jgi:hypothetical protein